MKTLVKFAALALVMVAGSASAQLITGTNHDMSGDNAQDNGRICVYCHTPHNANPAATAMPLWNRDITAETFTMYTSPTLDMVTAGSPQGVSLACLGCHDGSIAYDSLFWGDNVDAGTTFMGGGKQVGPDLTGDHPISITYDPSLDTAFVAAVGGKVDILPLFDTGADQVECASCHSVHDDSNGKFLRKDNTGSALCLTCHVK